MFIIQDGKITSEKTLDIGKLRVINLVFKSDLQFADDDKFKLVLGSIESENYAFVDDGCLRFSYVDVSDVITKSSSAFSVQILHNGSQILADSITITAVIQGGGSSDVQGIVFNASPYIATEVKIVPQDFTKDQTDFQRIFYYCKELTSIPQFDTSNGKKFISFIDNCSLVITIPQFDVGNGTDFTNCFRNCTALENFGGFLNLKYPISLSSCTNLTHDSLLNVLNGLYDLTGSNSRSLRLGTTNLAKLTDEEKAIATNKNWTLA